MHRDRGLLDDRAPASRRLGDDARPHAERQRHAGAVGVARGKPEQHRPGKVREQIRDDRARARTAVAGSSQRGSSPNTTAGARGEQAGEPQLRQHAIEPIRTLGDFVDEQHVPVRRIEGERRAERRQELGQRAADQRCRRLRRDAASRAADASIARPARRASARARTMSRSYAASPRARRPSSIGPWNDTTPQRVVSHDEERRVVAVADERLGRAPHLGRHRAAAAAARCRSRRGRRSARAIDGSRPGALERGRADRGVAGHVARGARRRSRRRPARARADAAPRRPASNSSRAKGLAGATTAMRSPGRKRARLAACATRTSPSRRRPPDARRGRGRRAAPRRWRPRPRRREEPLLHAPLPRQRVLDALQRQRGPPRPRGSPPRAPPSAASGSGAHISTRVAAGGDRHGRSPRCSRSGR